MNFSFKNKTVLVTGGSKGIGLEISKKFFNNGANVYRTSRKSAKDIIDKKNRNFIKTICVDFSDQKSFNNFLDLVKKKLKIDILINNAGINKINNIENIPEGDWDKIQNVNLRAPFLIIKNVVPKMKVKKFGRIINISSIFSEISRAKRGPYSASKSALNGLTRAISLELSKYSILVNSVSPGFVKTSLTKKILSPKDIKILKKEIPVGDLANPSEIANVILFLSSDFNTYISGQNIVVDGGYSVK